MNKNLLICLIALFTVNAFSQKVIEQPEYGLSNIPGELTKIELTNSATIIHFYIKTSPGEWIYIPKKSYIQAINSDEKHFVTKTEGIPLAEKYFMPDSGEVHYKLVFPKLESAVSKVDFGEANPGGNWKIYDIVINAQELASIMPKKLHGNWFQTNGSNQWDYGFYVSYAIVDKGLWHYKSVKENKKTYTIVLESNGKEKTLYAQINKKSETKIGGDRKKMINYSLEKIENPNYKPKNNQPYTASVFKLDTATYSGVIKGYTIRSSQKTGTIHVNNVFTGNQDSHLVKIADDGSFSVTFPVAHPQTIFVRFPNANTSVFVEPGKETFHYMDRNNPLFMGDCGQTNMELKALESIRFFKQNDIMKSVLETSPKDYKALCRIARDKERHALNELSKKQFISKKALQIKNLDIEYGSFVNILSYNMNRRYAKRKNVSKENKPATDFKIEASFYDFITKSILNDNIAVLSNHYSSFINRLMYAEIFRDNKIAALTTFETAKLIQKSGVTLSKEELMMAEASKEVQTIDVLNKEKKFSENYRDLLITFIRGRKGAFKKVRDKNKKINDLALSIAAYLKENGHPLTDKERELIKAIKSIKTTDEVEKEKSFTNQYGEVLKAFNEKHKTFIQDIMIEKRFRTLNNKMKETFGETESFIFDVIKLQQKCRKLEDFIPYSDAQIQQIQEQVNHPFLSNYIVVENNRTKAKIEANKTKGGYTVNKVEKTEDDELFESMIAKFKGKVIYVDFWATWCGPCKSGISKIAPLKEEMKNDNVVFLYVTNQTSPEGTWKNAITDIKGEHYKVSTDEWNYLAGKFNISGIPHYTLVNKQGKVVKPKMGHKPNETLKTILKAEIEK